MKEVNQRIILILLNILIGIVISLYNDINSIAEIYFYFVLINIFIFILINKNIRLIDVWNSSFIFIILSEALVDNENLFGKENALIFLIISNIIVNISFYANSIKKIKKNKKEYIFKYNKSHYFLYFLVLIYFFLKIKNALITFQLGRNTALGELESNLLITTFIDPIAFILPAVIAYVFKYKLYYNNLSSFIISLPIFTILFLEGTRFPLLFSIVGFIIVIFRDKLITRFKLKDIILLVISGSFLILSSSLMKHLRSSNSKDEKFIIENDSSISLAQKMSSYMSPEGVIDMTDLMFKYFETHDHTYGASSSFIMYFWIPRSIWPEKPTMIGHWLVREYRGGFAEYHSASFGFTGDFYADFGLFSFILFAFLGLIINKLESFKNYTIYNGSFDLIITSLLFSYIFFFVRSPITSSINFLGTMFYYFLLKSILFKKNGI